MQLFSQGHDPQSIHKQIQLDEEHYRYRARGLDYFHSGLHEQPVYYNSRAKQAHADSTILE
ncbi:hypothetical protein LEAN103870_06140 [Legionella anisa]|uniref:Uncharacterized protein n=1 Tax=Legionella anisa TaxID=28082 RepID=A0AAX0WQ59_9GAMM|nr:hypothetical protein [Legionella anisa]AWN75596.1 hypothetical protein DLD14_18105 [Legionella anisa]KTC76388.1 hypothetical protein Lani_0461 [Legionella anisa]MBN5934837.1 hypothetical protein [Legionella anisa]MCW8424210.1 hypothetical protein [Legionella anisa]MCW8446672.1 hypothetical protein [Legionella anisa]